MDNPLLFRLSEMQEKDREIARLKADLEAIKEYCDLRGESDGRIISEYMERNRKIEGQLDALRRVLKRYGQHDESCPLFIDYRKKICTCGFAEALKEAGE
jgi:hypothetical protein